MERVFTRAFADGAWHKASMDDFGLYVPDVDQPFRSLVGHLMLLANQARPGVLHAMRAIARYTHAPKVLHWRAA